MGKSYELKANRFSQVVSKPGEPLRVKDHVKGDKVELDDERAAELIKAGAIVDPSAKKSRRGGPSQAPGETKAPDEPAGDGTTPAGSGADAGTLSAEDAGKLKGKELDAELAARNLSTDGSEKDKQDRLSAAVSA